MKARLLIATLVLALGLSTAPAQTNVAPTVEILSANMRAGTTLMDIFFRVNDPDDATVKVRALAFKDGVRSFANVIRPVTFAEGSGDKIGDAIPANANHALTWDVGADWNIDLGQAKFEILAMDGRGLLSFDWITIPAAGSYPQVTVSTNSPSTTQVMNALYWLYASGDPGLSLTNGVLSGNRISGLFSGMTLASAASPQTYAAPFVFKRMNVDVAKLPDVAEANAARAGMASIWPAANRPYSGFNVMVGWGSTNYGNLNLPTVLGSVDAISAGDKHSLALKSDGTVIGWGYNNYGQATPPTGLTGVTAIAAGYRHSMALKGDGTVVVWGAYSGYPEGQTPPPAGLTGVVAISAGTHSLALKSDGTVVAWGGVNSMGETNVPSGLTGVTAISAGYAHSLARKSDSTVVAWGHNADGQTNVPSGLTGVTAIDAGAYWSLVLKSNGTVVAWGRNTSGEATPPSGLTGVTAIAALYHGMAIKGDGTVVGWGYNLQGQATPPAGLTGATAIAVGEAHSLALKSEAP